ncbi:hypothetical protein DRN97_06090 [Methanosarcinales archaeon]|nr:MAG: hypothetical protein DRN97_06090 [Methanosarcinales archaeon]
MKEEDLRALLSEQRSLANEYHTSIWRSSHFFSALITALLGLSAVLIGSEAPEILALTFPFLALLFSIFGILVLYRGSRYYLQATYAISVLRNKLDIQDSLKKEDLKVYGIDDLLCDRFSSAEDYVKKRSINLKQFRIRTIIYWIYIVLAIMSLLFMGYVFCST